MNRFIYQDSLKEKKSRSSLADGIKILANLNVSILFGGSTEENYVKEWNNKNIQYYLCLNKILLFIKRNNLQ